MQINLPVSLFHPALKRRGYQAPGLFTCCQCLPHTGLQVLVVDNDADSRYLLKLIFEEYGVETIAACSALEALEILKQIKPDLLISELRLPKQDGYWLICKVKALETQGTDHIPAIALTTSYKQGDLVQALASGFDKYLSKPFKIDDLLAIVACLTTQVQWVPAI